ncbi:hypothetical protein BTO32_15500 [Marinobacter lutaoensis]|uniref:DUF4148 domain-containing protein n=1 Tax=Marinobacter lutaoensis TaxID=135739 RepID=A0A1V2DPZ8_9GAMM|nr:hypothetical protein [Marinobacter lutaoensis]ONF42609.1 hypothetical protein BTO32_15500 [Marinobacter lutaoensis]
MTCKLRKIAAAALMAALCSNSAVADEEAAQKFITQYERGQSVNGPVVNVSRQPLWNDEDMVGAGIAEQVTGAMPIEVSHTEIGGANIVAASGLKTVMERLKEEAEFRELLERVQNEGALGDVDYGHKGHLKDLQERAAQLELLLISEQ